MAIYRVKFYRIKEDASLKQLSATIVTDSNIPLTEQYPLETLFTLDFLKANKSTTSINLGPGVTCDLTFNALRYHKRIYQPGRVEIRLKADNLKKNESVTLHWEQALAAYFRGLVVDVEDIQDKTIAIASKYYIFQIVPRVVKGGQGTSIDLQLTAYSPDKFLTLDQFSNAFTGKRLFGEMIPTMLTRYQQKGTFRKFIQLTQAVQANLNFLTAEMTEKRLAAIINSITDPALKATYENILKAFQSQFQGEFILPYSVQYNESFYDFLVRMLNRYGEYLYMEEGVLHVGLPDRAGQCTTISHYKSYALVDNAFQTLDNISVAHPNAVQDPYAVYPSNQEMIYNSEISTEEQCTPLPELEKLSIGALASITGLSAAGNSALEAVPVLIRKASDYLNQSAAWMIVLFAGVTVGLETWHRYSKKCKENEQYNKTYFTTDQDENETNEEYQKRQQQYSKKKDQFAPYSNLAGMSKEMFRRIELEEQQMSRTQMQVECDGDFRSILLGDFFQLDTDNQTYITTEIIGEAKWEKKNNQEDKDKKKETDENENDQVYTSSLTVSGVPIQTTAVQGNSQPASIYWPIPADQARIRQSGPQTAYVVANDDPMQLGRVRVKYAWQAITKDEDGNFEPDDATPWIRISSPMASEGSGFLFTPSLQDEVLINFENENIEHPYMVGALYNKQNAPQTVPSDFDLTYTGNHSIKSITSNCGHSITFQEGISGANFIKNVFPPALKSLLTFVPPAAPIQKFLDDNTKDAKTLSGGIQMTDQMGFYSVTMSAENRSVSIKCPLGNVEVSAFTGIKIIAPNGNIDIEGKNINITAHNKLNVVSGTNIATPSDEDRTKTKWQQLKSQATKALKDVVKNKIKEYVCDLSLIRTILEVFLKPIDGTLRIKSKRYLCMEAGIGQAKIFSDEYYKSMDKNQYKLQSKGKESAATRIRNLDAYICELLPTTLIQLNNAREKAAVYKQAWKKYNIHFFPEQSFRDDIGEMINLAIDQKKSLPKLDLPVFKDKKLEFLQAVKKKELDKIRQDLLDTLRRTTQKRTMETLMKKYHIDEKYAHEVEGTEEFRKVLREQQYYENVDGLLAPKQDSPLNRYLMLKLRRKCINNALEDIMKDTSLQRSVEWNDDDEEESWSNMINSLEYAKPGDGLLSKIGEIGSKVADAVSGTLGDVTGFSGFSDQYVWDTEDRGEILFSNDKETLHYKDNAIEPYPTQRTTPLEEAKQALLNIKL